MPLVISVTTIVIGSLKFESHADRKLYCSLLLSFITLSLAENAIVTGLIVTRIFTIYRRGIQGFGSESHDVRCANELGRDVAIMSILIESGVITFMVQLLQALIYQFDYNAAYPIIEGLLVMLYVRGFTQALNCC